MVQVGDLIPFGMGEFFGDGSDGVLDTIGNVTFPTTAHTGLVVKQYKSIKINNGHTVTVNNPCRGLVLYSQGDVTIDGTIDMSKKAGFGVAEIPPLVITKLNSADSKTIEKYYQLATVLQTLKGGAGGNGGFGGGNTVEGRSTGGSGGQGRINLGGYGGGGGGGQPGGFPPKGGNGGSIVHPELGGGMADNKINITDTNNLPYADGYTELNGIPGSCGQGGTGGSRQIYQTNPPKTSISGRGGYCYGGGGGGSGGVGPELAYNTFSQPGGNGEYSGGFLCIVAKGNVTINGNLASDGGSGGQGSAGAIASNGTYIGIGGGGGGGGGGGVIAIFHKGIFTNNGNISVAGGIGGAGGYSGIHYEAGGSGASGSIGTIHIQQI